MRQDLISIWNESDTQSAQAQVKGAAGVPIEAYCYGLAVAVRGVADLFRRFNPQFSTHKIIDDVLKIVNEQAHNEKMQGTGHSLQ